MGKNRRFVVNGARTLTILLLLSLVLTTFSGIGMSDKKMDSSKDMLNSPGGDPGYDYENSMHNVVIQPGEAESKDTWITNVSAGIDNNFGLHDRLWVGNSGSSEWRSLIQFDLPEKAGKLEFATLYLHSVVSSGQTNVSVRGISSPWDEGTGSGDSGIPNMAANWTHGTDDQMWLTPTGGGDYHNRPRSYRVCGETSVWYSWDVTDIVERWLSGSWVNNGFILQPARYTPSFEYISFHSSNSIDPSLYPKLILSYSVEIDPPVEDQELMMNGQPTHIDLTGRGHSSLDHVSREDSNQNQNIPFWGDFADEMHYQNLYTADEVGPSGKITRISFSRPDVSAGATGVFQNLKISLAHTQLNEITDTFADNFDGNLIEVFNENKVELGSSNNDPWIHFDLNGDFYYDNTKNLLMDIQWVGDNGNNVALRASNSNPTHRRAYAYNVSHETGSSDLASIIAMFRKEVAPSNVIDHHLGTTLWPFAPTQNEMRYQMMYQQGDVNQEGIIDKLSFQYRWAYTRFSTFENFTIRLAHTTRDDLVAEFDDNPSEPWVEVLNRSSYTLGHNIEYGWIVIDVEDIFYYNNQDNLLIEIRFRGAIGNDIRVTIGSCSYVSKVSDNRHNSTSGTLSSIHFNMQMIFVGDHEVHWSAQSLNPELVDAEIIQNELVITPRENAMGRGRVALTLMNSDEQKVTQDIPVSIRLKDTWISNLTDLEDTNWGGDQHLFVGRNNLGHERRSLVEFELPANPEGELMSATFSMVVSGRDGPPMDIAAYAVSEPWREGTSMGLGETPVNWHHRDWNIGDHIYFNDFEEDDGGAVATNDWEYGVPTAPSFLGARSGVNVWATVLDGHHNDLGDFSYLTFQDMVLPDAPGLCLEWWQYYEVFAPFDYGEILIDGDTVYELTGNGEILSHDWMKETVDISAYAGQTVDITFSFYSTIVVSRYGWYIDDLAIRVTDPPVPWSTAGGDYHAAESSSVTVSTTGARYTWDITSIVQNWLDGTWENNGIMLMGENMSPETSLAIFYSSDYRGHTAYWPKVTLLFGPEIIPDQVMHENEPTRSIPLGPFYGVNEGVSGESSTQTGYPFYGSNEDECRMQTVYTPQQIGTGGEIKRISFLRTPDMNVGIFHNLSILLAHTQLDELTTTFANNYEGFLVEVFSVDSYETTSPDNDLWIHFELNGDFVYDGSRNLLVELRWQGDNGNTVYLESTYEAGAQIKVFSWDITSPTGSLSDYLHITRFETRVRETGVVDQGRGANYWPFAPEEEPWIRSQLLYKSDMISASGIIEQIRFQAMRYSREWAVVDNLVIRMAHSQHESLTTDFDAHNIDPWVEVMNKTRYTVQTMGWPSWIVFDIDDVFEYNGNDHLLIDIMWVGGYGLYSDGVFLAVSEGAPYNSRLVASPTYHETSTILYNLQAIFADNPQWVATSSDPSLFTVDVSGGSALEITPQPDQYGNGTIDLRMMDGSGSLIHRQNITVTIVEVNEAPDVPSDPSPADGATGVSTAPTLSVQVSDPDGDAMDVTFYDASDDSVIETALDVPSGGMAEVVWEDLLEGTMYEWYVIADDGRVTTQSPTWSFTTSYPNNPPDAPANPSPSDGATNIGTAPTLSVDVFDADGDTMTVRFYDASDDSLIGTASGVSSGTTASVVWSGLSLDTTYEWYAVADDGHDTTRSATWSFTTADANQAPNAPSDPSPADGAVDVGTSPTLTVSVTDPDGDTMTVRFYDASDDSLIGTASGVSSGTTASVVWSGLSFDTTYEWYAVADDGHDTTQSATWSFTTVAANQAPNAPSDPSPADGAVDVGTSPTLRVAVSDPDGDAMTVRFYDASDDSLIGTASGVSSGTTASVVWSGLSFDVEYEWYAVADDGHDTTRSATWSFTTVAANQAPNAPSDPSPADGAVDVGTSPTLRVAVSDPDGDTMTVRFYDASDDSLIGTASGVSSGTTASVVWSDLSFGMEYEWYAEADDGHDTTRSATWSFTTITAEDDEPPVASAEADKTEIRPGGTVIFDGSGSTDNVGIVRYTWIIEGEEFQGVTVSYTFDTPGTYTIRLVVEDAAGNTDEDTIQVKVTEKEDDSGFPLLWLALIIVAVIIVLLLVILLSRRGSKDQEEFVPPPPMEGTEQYPPESYGEDVPPYQEPAEPYPAEEEDMIPPDDYQ